MKTKGCSSTKQAPGHNDAVDRESRAPKNSRVKANRGGKSENPKTKPNPGGTKSTPVPQTHDLVDGGMPSSKWAPPLLNDLFFYRGLLAGQRMPGDAVDAWVLKAANVFLSMLGWRNLEDIDPARFNAWFEGKTLSPESRDNTADCRNTDFLKELHYFVGSLRELSALPLVARNKLKALDKTLRALLAKEAKLSMSVGDV